MAEIDSNPSFPEARCFQAEPCGKLVLLHNHFEPNQYDYLKSVSGALR